ncbi:ABC transporter ATP-binding protein [Pelagibacterium lentulum]|uniref:Sugar ABC transporter ATP-binding protein n=1 Tax=Pelagibacterium lentulum TaxID=2029865 RepID=A0A916W1F2_9HYPH|nr:ABC transporter ATP-binding protein [Pelagibacterium lentulum]GGA59464.1 sugar ABC transporter ATP-binding protein [Pelagibacterium lentulum]
MASLDIVSLSKTLGTHAILKSVSLNVPDGAFMTLVGPSGCGKSTLLKIISGLELQDDGDVRIDGMSVSHLHPKLRDIAMVFQSYALYPHMTVYENIAVPLVLRRLALMARMPLLGKLMPGTAAVRQKIDSDVRTTADMLELTQLLTRKPVQLSGGQRQRVALGRAMVRDPKIFLMDEPLSNLDAKLRVHMRAEIARLHKRLGATFVYVTHDQIEAMTMSTHVAVMMEGEILQVDSPQRIYAEPADIRVAEFIGSPKINVLPGRVREDGALAVPGFTIAGRTQLPTGSQASVGFRPEHITLAQKGVAAPSATIINLEHTGPEVFVHASLEGLGAPLTFKLEPHQAMHLASGDQVGLGLSLGHAHLFDAQGKRAPFMQPVSEVVAGEVRYG